MKFIILTSLLFTTIAYGAEVIVPKLPIPLNGIDKTEMSIQGYAEYIRPEKIEVVKYDIEKLDIEKFIEITEYRDGLIGAVKSVRVSHWINIIMEELKKAIPDLAVIEYAKVQLRLELAGVISTDSIEKLVEAIQNPVFPVLPVLPFFVAVGEVKYDTDLSKFPEYVKLLVPVYSKDIQNFKAFIEKVRKTNLQIIPAFDFDFNVVFLSDILIYKDVKNTKGESIFHSAITLWGATNIIDMNDYEKASNMAFELWVALKYNWKDLWVWRQMCLFPEFEVGGIRKDAKWGDSTKFGDGDWWWNIHSYPAFEVEGNTIRNVREISGARPVVLGGFFGSYPVFNVTYAIEHFPKLEEQWQREGWNGSCLINIDNWLQVLK